MDCWVNQGTVTEIINAGAEKQELRIKIGNKEEMAVNFPDLTGTCQIGDRVILNTTAITLGLGTGGSHFVMGVIGKTHQPELNQGHIIKVRYTPSQGRVLSVEEPDSPYHEIMASQSSISGMPVMVGSLHSMLAPVCIGFKHLFPEGRIVYLMSDGAALPLALSKQVTALIEHELLDDTITFNHAFGGRYEAVNVYSALIAARHVCRADAAVILMGPGVVGTGTPWGTTALEQGIYLNAVNTLGGYRIGIARISTADPRPRHQGISHHTLTALTRICEHSCVIPLPEVLQDNPIIKEQLKQLTSHKIKWIATQRYRQLLAEAPVTLKTMDRDFNADPFFFESALAAGLYAGSLLNDGATGPDSQI